MKAHLFLIICLLSKAAVSQTVNAPQQPLDLPQTGYVGYAGYAGITPLQDILDINSRLPQNQNFYNGGNRDTVEIDGVIPFTEKYIYKEFIDGNLIYSSGNQSQRVKMNYHLLYGEMQFIDKEGDTLFIAPTDSIAYVRFEEDFYQHNFKTGYLKILGGNDQIKLCSQQKLKLHAERFASSKTYNIPVEHLALSKKEDFYLVDKEVTYEATKSGFQNSFPNYKQQIEGYLQQMARQRTPIKFYREEDLVTLLSFCTSLN